MTLKYAKAGPNIITSKKKSMNGFKFKKKEKEKRKRRKGKFLVWRKKKRFKTLVTENKIKNSIYVQSKSGKCNNFSWEIGE